MSRFFFFLTSFCTPSKLFWSVPTYFFSCLCQGTTGPEGQSTTRPQDQRTTGREDQRTRGPQDERTTGPEDHRTTGPEDQRTTGPEDQRATGREDHRTRGPEDHRTRGPQGQRSLNFFSRGCKYFFPGNVIFFPGNVDLFSSIIPSLSTQTFELIHQAPKFIPEVSSHFWVKDCQITIYTSNSWCHFFSASLLSIFQKIRRSPVDMVIYPIINLQDFIHPRW